MIYYTIWVSNCSATYFKNHFEVVCFHLVKPLQMLATLTRRPDEEMLEILAYRTVAFVHFADQNWIPKTVYCIRCVMVYKVGFTNCNVKIAPLLASMVLNHYIKLFRTVADRHNGILMSLLLLVAETIIVGDEEFWLEPKGTGSQCRFLCCNRMPK